MRPRPRSIWIGFEPREAPAFDVARSSILRRLSASIPVHALVLSDLRLRGLYTRPTEVGANGRLQDVLSRRHDYDGEMSTEFALSRFLVPQLAREGLALFIDCDMLVRADPALLFDHCERADPGKAVYCVKHRHIPDNTVKMDGCRQTQYGRKNWSSVMVFDCEHPANRRLTPQLVNNAPGRDLHGFVWLADGDIGELGREWNFLVGHSPPVGSPQIVHHTDGAPCLAGFEDVPFAEEWRDELARWDAYRS